MCRQGFFVEADPFQQVVVEAPLDGADRHILPVAGLVDVVPRSPGIERVFAALVGPQTGAHQAVGKGKKRGRAVNDRGVDDLALSRLFRLEKRANNSEGQIHSAAAKITDKIERRDRAALLATDRMQSSGHGDVIDVVSSGAGQRPLLAKARHSPEHQSRIDRQAFLRTKAQAFHDAGTESLDQGVGVGDQPLHDRDALRRLEIDADRTPSPIKHVEAGLHDDA